MFMLLEARYLQPALWYFLPELVTYTHSLELEDEFFDVECVFVDRLAVVRVE